MAFKDRGDRLGNMALVQADEAARPAFTNQQAAVVVQGQPGGALQIAGQKRGAAAGRILMNPAERAIRDVEMAIVGPRQPVGVTKSAGDLLHLPFRGGLLGAVRATMKRRTAGNRMPITIV